MSIDVPTIAGQLEKLSASAQQYRLLFSQNKYPMWVYDLASLRLVAVNRAMVELYGYSEQELLTLDVPELWFTQSPGRAAWLKQRQYTTDDWTNDGVRQHRNKDGTLIEIEVSVRKTLFDGESRGLALGLDMTLRLSVERELARVRRAQQMLSTCNEALIRAKTQKCLLGEVCRIAVDMGGYCGAWVGAALEDVNKTLEILHFEGRVPEYIHKESGTWSDAVPEGRGQTGRAIRSGLPEISADLDLHQHRQGWGEQRRAAGIRGAISLPLKNSERTFGVLTLYSHEVLQLVDEEIHLLQELSNDLAFGIGNLQAQLDARLNDEVHLNILRSQQEIASIEGDLQYVMTVMAERARQLCGGDGGAVDLIDGEALLCQVSSGKDYDLAGLRFSLHSSLVGEAARNGFVVMSEDVNADPRVDQNSSARLAGMRSLIVAPLKVDGVVIGVLKVAHRKPRAFAQREATYLQMLAETLGLVIKRKRMALELQASENQYRKLFVQNQHPMWVYELNNLKLVAVNRAMVALYGYSEEELLSMSVPDLWLAYEPERVTWLKNGPRSQDDWSTDGIQQHRKKDGTRLEVEVSARTTVFDGIARGLKAGVDVTERRRAERELARVSRAQQMLSNCNEALIRATSQDGLLREMCRIAVEIGGYYGASVGFAMEDEGRTIRRLCFAGKTPVQHHNRQTLLTDKTAEGHGPSRRAIRSGNTEVCEDTELAPSGAHWREARLSVGIRGVVALPLKEGSHAYGVFTLYSREVLQLSREEISLLQELASDLAYGIANLRAREEQRRALLTLREQAALLDKAQDAIVVRDMDHKVTFWNQGAERLYGWSAQEARGRSVLELTYPSSDGFERATQQVLQSGAWAGEVVQQRKNGTALTIEARWSLVSDDEGKPLSILAINTDISQRKTAESAIQQLAFYDSLTQLPNRALMIDRLAQALSESERSDRGGALLFIDLDNFKTLNDTMGHDKGDMLLKQVAHRLSGCVRHIDTVARFGGDEFVVILRDLGGNTAETSLMARAIGEKMLATVAEPYVLDGYEHRTTSSIGVAPFGRQHCGASELLKQADLAMYQAKAVGRNAIRFFDPAMQALVNSRAQMELDMRTALTQKQYVLHYQPQCDATGIIGVEALVRWERPTLGMVSPAEFIPMAEETGIIIPLGHWVLVTACELLAQWRKSPATAHLVVAVNVSSRQFRSADFVSQVAQALQSSGANPAKLKLELTESLLVDDLEVIIAKMTSLKSLGVQFSLDDFGTGYSSLSYLKRLPLDQLKIDQSFVRDIMTDANDASIVRTIIALGQSLGLAVIAEGVETASQRDYLASHGCLAYQGYFFSRPLPLAALQRFLQSATP